jgi:lipopolysaccharide export system protein LptA
VSVVQLEDGTTVFGDSLVNFESEGRTVVDKNPRLMQVDTSSAGEVDTLIVESDRMVSVQDSTRSMYALGNVRMARSNLAARCRDATFDVAGDRIILVGDPIVWHEGNQLTGDSITITVRERRLNSVLVRGHAMAVSRADSARTQRFDQISGRHITMTFREGKVDRIDVEETATSLYYVYDDVTPNGMNISSGNRIIIEFEDGRTNLVKVIGGVEGEYYPEKMIFSRESDYNLDGFRWVRQRPVRKGMKLNILDVD